MMQLHICNNLRSRLADGFGTVARAVAVIGAFAAQIALAADWTDADNATYTALKSINGGGSGYIATDFTPLGTDTVKFKYKPSTVSGNECIYCSRFYDGSYVKKQFCGFRIDSAFRIDSHDQYKSGKTTISRQYTCNTTNPLTVGTEYILSADYYNAAVTINGTPQTLSGDMPTSSSADYTPGSILVLLASHTSTSANAASAATLTGIGNLATGDLYYFQLWSKEGTLSHDFRPAVCDSNSVTGLYDTVTRKFYPPTAGSFTGVELPAVATATWTGAANNGDFSDAGNWTCYDGVGNPLANVIPLSTTDITLGADVPDAGWTAFDASSYAGTIDLNGHRLVICGGSNLAFSVTDFSSGTPGELRFTIPENETFEKTAALRITSGNLSLVKDGPGAFLWSHDEGSALSSVIPVLVTNGVFKIGATHGNLFGASGTVTVKAPGQFDINTTEQYGPVRARTFYIEGDGPDGSGAIVNSAANTQWGYQLNKVVLTGDATIGGRGSIELRDSGNGIDCGGYELTVKNTGRLLVESGTHLTNATDIVISGGTLQVCNSCVLGAERIVLENGGTFLNFMSSGTKGYNVPFVVHEGTNTISSGKNYYHIYSPVTVESGCTLNLPTDGPWYDGAITNETGAAMNIGGDFFAVGGIFRNDGTVVHTAKKLYFGSRDDVTHPCRVENNGTIRTTGGDFQLKAESSMTGTGTLELAGGSPKVLGDLSGFTGTVVVSNGLAITFTGMNCGGTVAVLEGSKLTIDATSRTSVSNLSLKAGSTLNIANYTQTVMPIAASALTLPAEGKVNLTMNGGAFGEGVYNICEMSGVTAADGANFAPSTGELAASWSVSNGVLILTVGDVGSNVWTGLAGDGNLSNPGNWFSGVVPTRGDTATINCGADTALTVGDVFCPDFIVFPETCKNVTISGENAITGISAITNLSSSTCTFEVPVAFADKINVSQGAYYYCNSSGDHVLVEGGHVRFAGGVTGTGFAEGTTRRLDGAYTIPATSGWVADTTDNVWTLPGSTEAGGSSLTITGSSYEVPGTTDTSMLLMGDGGAFTTGVVRTSNRLSYRIYGEYVVTDELEVALTQDTFIAQRQYGTYKFEKFTLSDDGTRHNFNLANSTGKASIKYVYIGAGGINVTGTDWTALVCGNYSSDQTHIYPWHSDYAINGKGGSTRDFIVYRATYLHTDDENGVARTVTLNGIGDVRAALTVKGSGRFQVNSDGQNGESDRKGSVTVTDSATLAFASGADLGAGPVTVDTNATLEVASGENTFEGGLTVRDGATLAFNFTERAVTPQIAVSDGKTLTAEGAVKVKIATACGWPTGGEKILTTCGGFTADKVSLVAGAPKWVRGLSVNDDGNIVLDVKPMGTIVIFR